MNAIFIISQCTLPSVIFECSNSIIQLTSSPSAVKIALHGYLTLLSEQNDNNVKLIVLNKIIELKEKFSKLLQDCIVEILSVVKGSSSHEIKKRALDLAIDLITVTNKGDVINFLEKEIKFASKELDDKEKSTNDYRRFIIKKVNDITYQFPDTIPSVLQALLSNFLCHKFNKQDDNALESAVFVKEVLECHSEYRKEATEAIRNNLYEIKSPKALRVLIWCLGEYSETEEDLQKAYDVLIDNIGSLPLKLSSKEKTSNTKSSTQQTEEAKQKVITKTVILADGSYGTETIIVDDKKHTSTDQLNDLNVRHPLRDFIEAEEFFLCGVLSITLCKLILKMKQKMNKNYKKMSVDSLIFFCSYIRIHQDNKKFDPDNKNRIAF